MASNSEANLPSDFDIDEVINWDEHNYSSKDIDFQLPSLDLPTDVKTSQNTTSNHPSLSTVVSSQQTTLPVTQNTNQYHALFGTPSNAANIRNSKTHGFPLVQSPLPPSFPSERLNIPAIAPSSSNASLLRFSSSLIPNTSLASRIHTQQLQNVQNARNMLTENVAPFTGHTIDDSTDLVEGPLDKIVDQIMDRELNNLVIMKTSSPSNTFDQHPAATFTNVQSRPSSSVVGSLQCVSGSSNITDSITTIQSGGTQANRKNTPGHLQSQFVMPSAGSASSNVVRTLSQATQNTGAQKKAAISLQNATDMAELFNIRASAGSAASTVGQNQFMDPLAKPSTIPTASLLSSQVNNLKPENPIMSTSLSGNMNLTIPLVSVNNLQTPVKTGSINNGLNRTQNNTPPKLAFVTSVSYSSPNNLASQAVQSQGVNIQRSVASSSPVHEPTAGIIPRTTSQTVARDVQVLLENLPLSLRQNFIQNLSKLGANNLPSHMGISQSKISSTTPTSSVFTLVSPTTNIGRFENQLTSAMGNHSNHPISNPSQNLSNQGRNNLPSCLGTLQSTQPTISSPTPNFMQGMAPRTTGSERNDNFSVFTVIDPSTGVPLSQSSQKQPVLQTSYSVASGVGSGLGQASATTTSTQSTITAQTTLKITSPSTNIAGGFKQPNFPEPSKNIQSLHSILSQLSPASSQSATTAGSNVNMLSKFQLGQSQASGMVSPTFKSSSMVFTVAPGSQGTAFQMLAGNEKAGGNKIFLLHQPSKAASDSRVQPMNILFVNEKSVGQVVSGPQKSSARPTSTAVVSRQSPVPAAVPSISFTTIKSDDHPHLSPVPDTSEGSPSSVNSSDSDVIPIAKLKQTETLKTKETGSVKEQKVGKKRKKDANKPVKPLSSFQRFFQKTQAAIRQQFPTSPFPEVSKIAKQMWEHLTTKEKKVYQDAWRTEREHYKKALEEYNASLNETELDGPSPKQLKNGQSSTSPISASPIASPTSEIVVTSTTSVVPAPSSSSSASNIAVYPPRGSGKPLAMMVELENKTKMASEQASGKAPGTAKSSSSSSWSKAKGSSNGIEDGASPKKKKLKINPVPKKSCVRENCSKVTKTTKERGTSFCSNECIMLHCRGVFATWVQARHASFKAAT